MQAGRAHEGSARLLSTRRVVKSSASRRRYGTASGAAPASASNQCERLRGDDSVDAAEGDGHGLRDGVEHLGARDVPS